MAALNKKILIVEDDPPLLKVLEAKFKGEGFEVLTAMNGEEGLESALENEPDIILLDLIMPKMDGVTMLKKLRETPYGAAANVVVLTNLSDSASVMQSMESGVYDYLVKTNWKLDAVVDRVKKILHI